MELDTDIESRVTLPSEESFAHDSIDGHTVPFVGVAHEENGPKDVQGAINWGTFWDPGELSVAGENQRDVWVCLSRMAPGGGFEEDSYGFYDMRLTAFDHDFMRRLLDRDIEAEAELVKIAEANPNRPVRYEISLPGTS